MSLKPKPALVSTFIDCMRTHATGADKALSANALIDMLGLERTKDPRSGGARVLRALANAAVLRGVIVCSTRDGYFIATTREEAEKSYTTLISAGKSMLTRGHMMQRLAQSMATTNAEATPLPLF